MEVQYYKILTSSVPELRRILEGISKIVTIVHIELILGRKIDANSLQ